MKRTRHNARLFRQVKGLSRKIERFSRGSTPLASIDGLIHRLRRKWALLDGASRWQLLRSTCVVAALAACTTARSQTFLAPIMDPFGMVTPNSYGLYAPFCQLVDVDADGDLDLFTADYNNSSFRYQPNTGSATAPAFGALQTDPFGLATTSFGTYPGSRYIYPEFADLDNDGDQDLLVLASDTGSYDDFSFVFLENTGSASAPAFGNESVGPFGLAPMTGWEFGGQISLADLDDDGDLDLVLSQYNDDLYQTELLYFENTGTSVAPSFAAAVLNPFGFDAGAIEAMGHAFADQDCDGDQDLFLSGYDSLAYFQNVGTAQAPAFAAMPALPGLLNPALGLTEYLSIADLDGDGDHDILIGTYDDGFYVYWEQENGCITIGVDDATGAGGIVLAPNPFTDRVRIELPVGHTFGVLVIADATSRELERLDVRDKSSITWAADEYPPGLYTCTMLGNGVRTIKLMKE